MPSLNMVSIGSVLANCLTAPSHWMLNNHRRCRVAFPWRQFYRKYRIYLTLFFISKTTNLRLYQHSQVVNELIRVNFISWSVMCKLLKEEWRSNSSELPIGAAVIAFRHWLHYFYRASGAKCVTSNIRKICEQFPIFVLLGSSHQEACAINTKNYWHMNILRSHDMLHMPIFWLVLRA